MAAGTQYSAAITATSAGGAVLLYVGGSTANPPLKARLIDVTNAGSSSAVYFNFTTTSGASTGDYALRAGKNIQLVAREGSYFTGFSYVAAATTSSSVLCDVLALG